MSSSVSSPSLSLSLNLPPSPPPAPTGSAGGNPNDFGQNPHLTSSTSLYLYTFLATVVLLLFVSVTIVARSYSLRRRQQATIAAAIRNGTYVPPKKPAVGEKPKLYEIYLGGVDDARTKETGLEKEKQRERVAHGSVLNWNGIMPIACKRVDTPSVSPSTTPAPAPASTPAPPTAMTVTQRQLRQLSSAMSRLQFPVIGRRQIAPSSDSVPLVPISAARASSDKTPTQQTRTPEPPEEMVRVVVFIHMPSSDPSWKRKSVASTSTTDAGLDLPYVEFGTAEVSAGNLASTVEAAGAALPQESAREQRTDADSNV